VKKIDSSSLLEQIAAASHAVAGAKLTEAFELVDRNFYVMGVNVLKRSLFLAM